MRASRKATLLVVTAVSVWHLGAVLAWLAPSSSVRDRVVRATARYVRLTKSDQSWGMFAPDPLSANRQLVARLRGASGVEREVDLTTPLVADMRSFRARRVGKLIKAQDRLLAGDEPIYERGFATWACRALERDLGERVARVTLLRDFSVLTLDTKQFRMTRSARKRASLGSYACD